MNSRMHALSQALILACLPIAALANDEPISDRPTSIGDGVFTVEQVERGESVYLRSCQRCHGSDLEATHPEAAGLTGGAFAYNWVGQNLRERYDRVKFTMPFNNAMSLTDQEYLDVIAYILNFNGYEAGPFELTPSADWLSNIIVEGPG